MEKPPAALTLLHVDDDPFFTAYVRSIILEHTPLRYSGPAANSVDAVTCSRSLRPDMLLLEASIGPGNGFEVIEMLQAESHPPRVVLLAGRTHEAFLYRARHAKIAGVISKTAKGLAALPAALREIAAGRTFFCREFSQALAAFRQNPRAFFKLLSARELQLLPLFARGDSDEEVSDQAGISRNTAHSHRQRILNRLDLHGTKELMHWARQKGFGEGLMATH